MRSRVWRSAVLGSICGGLIVYSQGAFPSTHDHIDEVHTLVGDCVGKEDEISCVQQIVLEHPMHARLRAYFSSRLLREGDIEGSLREIEHAIQLEPSEADFHILRAKLLKMMGDLEGAEAEGMLVKELNDRMIEAFLNEPIDDIDALLAQAHRSYTSGEFEVSASLFERYFELCEIPDPHNLCHYAEVLGRTQDYDAAMEIFEAAFASTSEGDLNTRAYILQRRARVKSWAGDSSGAEQDNRERDAVLERLKIESE